jgi:hypothetical protein
MTAKETSKEVIDELCKILDASPKKYREAMTPKKKAKYLVDKYDETLTYLESKAKAKQCALIAVEEIVQSMDDVMLPNPFKQYWKHVKQEIQKL